MIIYGRVEEIVLYHTKEHKGTTIRKCDLVRREKLYHTKEQIHNEQSITPAYRRTV